MGSLTHLTDFVAAVASMSRETFLQSCPFPALVIVPPQSLTPGPLAHGVEPEQASEIVEGRLNAVLNAVTEAQVGFLAPPRAGVEAVVGRHPNCASVVRDPTVSLHHAEFAHKRSVWRVTDLESANGTFVEQRRVPVGIPSGIVDGQLLRFGSVPALFLSPSRLHDLVRRSREVGHRLIVPSEGVLLGDLISILNSPNAPSDASPPFLVRLAQTEQVDDEADLTQSLPDTIILGLRPKEAGELVRVYSLAPRVSGQTQITVGRRSDCDVIVHSQGTSKRHAIFQQKGPLWRVVDLESQNGTWLRGKRLPPGVLTRIDPGDTLKFAGVLTAFVLPEGMRLLIDHVRQTQKAKQAQKEPTDQRRTVAARRRPTRAPGLAVLLVTGDDERAATVEQVFANSPFLITRAQTTAGALEALRGGSFRLVITESVLVDGEADRLLQRLSDPPLPAVVLVTQGESYDLSADVTPCLSLTSEALKTACKRALRSAGSTQAMQGR